MLTLNTIALKDLKLVDKWENAAPGSLLQVLNGAESVIALRFASPDKTPYLLILTGLFKESFLLEMSINQR